MGKTRRATRLVQFGAGGLLVSTALCAASAAPAQDIAPVAPAVAIHEPATATKPAPASIAPETPSGGVIQDIIVTAERRASSVQRTPIAISAIGGDALRAAGISGIEGLNQSIPNLTFSRNSGDAKIHIRGIGYNSIAPGGETRVALYTDGIYQSRTQAGLLGFYDIDRVEVLRGPQGTLYGRNSIAGTINILTRDPGHALNGYVTGTLGNYGLIGTEGAVGGALSSAIQARLAIRTVDRQGYGKNLTTGEDYNDEHTRSIRGKLRFEPTSSLTVSLIGDYSKQKDHSGGYAYIGPTNPAIIPLGFLFGGIVPTNKQDYSGFGVSTDLETYGFSGQAELSVTDTTKLTFLAGYRHLDYKLQDNVDGTTAELSKHFRTEQSDVLSQEIRLSQKVGRLADIIIGGYYFHETNTALNEAPVRGTAVGADPSQFLEFFATFGRLKTDAFALFAQANVHLTNRLELDLGGRYSYEKKKVFEQLQVDFADIFTQGGPLKANFNPAAGLFGGEANQKNSQSSFDPKFTLSYQAADTIFLYATYSRGFKSGGFNIGGLQSPFRPEKLTNYEAGVKADLFDRRLRMNVSAFNYDYKDLQVNITSGPAIILTRNAASARIRGIEAEISMLPVRDLRLVLNAAYLDAKYQRYLDTDPAFPEIGVQSLAGRRLNSAPRYKLDGEIGYTVRTTIGNFTPRATLTWTDQMFFSPFNTKQLSQPSRTELNLYVNWDLPGSGWSLVAYAKNLTNDTYVLDAAASSSVWGIPAVGQYGPPRTFAVSITKAL